MLVALDHGQRLGIQPRRGHRVVDAVDALALHVKMRRLHPLGVGHRGPGAAVRPVTAQPHGEQADLLMAQSHNIFREPAHRVAVVDTDP